MKTKKQGPRLVVGYVGGGWTDKLAVGRYGIDLDGSEVTLSIDVTPRDKARSKAFREFVSLRGRVETIQIARRAFVEQLQMRTRLSEARAISVKLCAAGHEVVYPAAVVYGPDAVTLSLG